MWTGRQPVEKIAKEFTVSSGPSVFVIQKHTCDPENWALSGKGQSPRALPDVVLHKGNATSVQLSG